MTTARDKAAPAFIRELILDGFEIDEDGRLIEGGRLKKKIDEVQEHFADEWKITVPLYDKKLSTVKRTRPKDFPDGQDTLVVFPENTAFDREETERKRGSNYNLAGVSIQPGIGVYATTIQVEIFVKNQSTDGAFKKNKNPLPYEEVMNIRCQNMIWAAYLAVLEIGESKEFERRGLRLIEVDQGMGFDNTRSEEFLITEYGTFSFHAFVG